MTTTPTLWKGAAQINATDKFDQYNAQVTPLKTGGYVAVWTDTSLTHNPNGTTVVGQVYDVLGNKVGGEVNVTGLTSGDHYDQAITTLASGNVAVAFVNHVTGHTLVRVFDPALHFLRQDDIGSASGPPAITALADGRYVVATGQSGASFEVQPVSSSGGLGSSSRLSFQADNVELATLSDSQVAAVFENHDNNTINFTVLQFGDNLTISRTLSLFAPAGTKPDVAGLNGGGFVVAWSDNTDVKMAIFTNALSPVTSTAGVTVNALITGDQHDASITALADGGFLVAWDDDNLHKQEGQRFDAHGNKVGGEFAINAFSSQRAGLLTEDTDGALLHDGRVVFVMNHQAGDYDVRHAIFDPRTSPILGTSAGETITSRLNGATVNGLGGSDTLFGNAGNDHFRFSTALGAGNVDKVVGFSHKHDTIDLDNAIFAKLKKEGTLKDKFFHIGKHAGDHNDFVLYDKKSGALSYDADGSKHGVAPVAFATLDAHLKLSHNDFLVV